MADINQVSLVGRLTRDAELKYSNGGMAICEFSLAINSRRKQGEQWVDEANFFDITVFGRQGEAIQQYLTKGKQVGIEGRLKQDRWQNQEGQNRSKVGIIANNVMLLGGRDGGGDGSGGGSGSYGGGQSSGSGGYGGGQPSGGRGPAPSGGQSGSGNGGYGGDDFPDDIPF